MSASRANKPSRGSSQFWQPLSWQPVFRQRWHRWLGRRLPPAQSVTLDHRKLFVLPTMSGAAFLLVICLLWLLGTNYENNLVFALTFLLMGLFIILPVHTFANLSGLRLQLREARAAFAGDYGLRLPWKNPANAVTNGCSSTGHRKRG